MSEYITSALIRLCDIGMGVTLPGSVSGAYPANLRPTILRGDPFQPDDVASAQCPFWLFELPSQMNPTDLPISSGQQYVNTSVDAFLCVTRREANVDLKYNVYETLSWRNAVLAQYAKHIRLSDPPRIVTAATNASPIQVTTNIPHRYSTGDQITLSNVLGNTAANGPFNVTVIDFQNFTLNGSTGNGAFVYSDLATSHKTQPFDQGNIVTSVIGSWGLVEHKYGATEFLALLFKFKLTEFFVTTISE